MNLTILPGAAREALSIGSDLENAHEGYGDAFALEVAKAHKAILALPEIHLLTQDVVSQYEIREYYIKRFKYRVIYALVEDSVIILTYSHASKEPGAWQTPWNRLDLDQ